VQSVAAYSPARWPINSTGAESLARYEAAMIACGLRPRCAAGAFRIEGDQAAADELPGEEGNITALVVANNLMTIGALRALRAGPARSRRHRPRCYRRSLLGRTRRPPLTTLAQPIRRMAECAVEFLCARITGKEHERSESQRLVFSFELRPCGSCGVRS